MSTIKEANVILEGDSLATLKTLPKKSISMVMTSPPYWALRDYNIKPTIWDEAGSCEHNWVTERTKRPNSSGGKNWDKLKIKGSENYSEFSEYNDRATYTDFCTLCGAWKGQLGLEPTFDLYIKHLADVFDEIKRVIRDDGCIYVNLGDCYAGNMGKKSGWTDNKLGFEKEEAITKGVCLTNKTKIKHELPQKCLVGIPFRFAVEMINRGWILRNTIIWHKPSCMPSSARDRFTIDFEYLFMFVKNKKYYFEQQFEPITGKVDLRGDNRVSYNIKTKGLPHSPSKNAGFLGQNVYGRNKRAVWSINTKPYPEAHFATYPESLCKTPILSGCPEFICNKCNKRRKIIIETQGGTTGKSWHDHSNDMEDGVSRIDYGSLASAGNEPYQRVKKGYTDCGCNAGFHSGIVLDPFMGAGTTALTALKLNRRFIGIEINPDYIKLAEKRIKPFINQTKLGGSY